MALKTLKWPVTAEQIKETLEEANISFSSELSRKELWDLYKEAQTATPTEEVQDSGEKSSEAVDTVSAPTSFQANRDPVVSTPEAIEPADQVEDMASVKTQDSQVDSVSPKEATTTSGDLKTDAQLLTSVSLLLNNALVVLQELSPYQVALAQPTKFVKTLDRVAVSTNEMVNSYAMHKKLGHNIRYSPVQHGVIVVAFEVIYAAYEANYVLCEAKYVEMLSLLKAKAANISEHTLARYRRYNNPKWVSILPP